MRVWTLGATDPENLVDPFVHLAMQATLDSWNLTIPRVSAVSGSGASYIVSNWVSGEGTCLPVLPHLHTIRDLAGNPLADPEPQGAPPRPFTVADSGLPGC